MTRLDRLNNNTPDLVTFKRKALEAAFNSLSRTEQLIALRGWILQTTDEELNMVCRQIEGMR
jgi:hypothetical protein